MTWHHVAALLIASAMVIACGVSDKCSANSFPHVVQLATAIVAGAFGHAGAQARFKTSKTDQQHETASDGR